MNNISNSTEVARTINFVLNQNTEEFCQYFENEGAKSLFNYHFDQQIEDIDEEDHILHIAARNFAKSSDQAERYQHLIKIAYLIRFVALEHFSECSQQLSHKNSANLTFSEAAACFNEQDGLVISSIYSIILNEFVTSKEANNNLIFNNYSQKINYIASKVDQAISLIFSPPEPPMLFQPPIQTLPIQSIQPIEQIALQYSFNPIQDPLPWQLPPVWPQYIIMPNIVIPKPLPTLMPKPSQTETRPPQKLPLPPMKAKQPIKRPLILPPLLPKPSQRPAHPPRKLQLPPGPRLSKFVPMQPIPPKPKPLPNNIQTNQTTDTKSDQSFFARKGMRSVLKLNKKSFCKFFENEKAKDLFKFRFDQKLLHVVEGDTILHFAARKFAKKAKEEIDTDLLYKITYLIHFAFLNLFDGCYQQLDHRNSQNLTFKETAFGDNPQSGQVINEIYLLIRKDFTNFNSQKLSSNDYVDDILAKVNQSPKHSIPQPHIPPFQVGSNKRDREEAAKEPSKMRLPENKRAKPQSHPNKSNN